MANATPLRVLVVEDETLIRWSIAETLAERGHTVFEAGSAAAAVDTLSQSGNSMDVVLLDFRLPDSNDLRLLARIRDLQPKSAVVMMTAFGTPEIRREALDMGAYRVVDKPFDMHGLESLVVAASQSRAHPV